MQIIVFVVVAIGFVADSSAEDFVCNGTFEIFSFEKCENPSSYKIDLEAKKRKINRTHDGITVKLDMLQDLTQDIGLLAEINKKCDGGYKFQQYFSDESLCMFFIKYAKDNFERALTEAGVDPPNCPIEKCVLEIKDFVPDYSQLQDQGMSGEFKVPIYLVHGHEKLACLNVYCGFRCKEEE